MFIFVEIGYMIVTHLDLENNILLKSNDTSYHVLFHIMKQMNIESNIWYADKINKEQIANKLNLSIASINKIVVSLYRRELILILENRKRGLYKLNEELFF